MLTYASLEITMQSGATRSPASGPGLPSSAQMARSSTNCLIQWPASFGNVGVNAYKPDASGSDICEQVTSFAGRLAPRIPK
ncbi:hypothetical protein [Actinomadura sp. NPDC000600]|uniref:hypothetical protein n=1 Tax=Actinomadura sp. NPDC000600 TaxID=3154262 RepID=UPI003393F4F3